MTTTPHKEDQPLYLLHPELGWGARQAATRPVARSRRGRPTHAGWPPPPPAAPPPDPNGQGPCMAGHARVTARR